MKKILLTILFILPFLGAWCQPSEPWFYDGKQWAKLTIGESPYCEWTTASVIQGSVEIDGMTYWKVFTSNKEDLSDLAFSGHYLRETDHKVYWYDFSTKEEALYMNFNLEKGDTFVQMNFKDMELWVVAVGDTILTPGDGISRKYIKVGFPGNDDVWDVWIEGIGSLTFGIGALCIGCTGGGNRLLCCHDAGKTLYMSEYNTCFREVLDRELLFRNKQWAVWSQFAANQPDGVTLTSVVKDSKMINNELYDEVWSSENGDLSDMRLSHYLREKAGKVYVYNEHLKKEYLWFDFNLNVGAKFSFYAEDPDKDATATVVAITDTIFPNGDGVKRKCFHLEPSYCGIMVEGIGSLSHGIGEFDVFSTGSSGKELLCCHDTYDDLLYQSESGTCYKSTGIQQNPSYGSFMTVRCPEKGKLSFSWKNNFEFQQLSIYTENGTLFQKEKIPSDECQLIIYDLPQGIYLYVFTSADNNETLKGKIYVI